MLTKTEAILKEAEYYTGTESGQKSPETTANYDNTANKVPTLRKVGELKQQTNEYENPQALPFPLQLAIQHLADVYLSTQDLRNKVRDAESLPVFKGKEEDLRKFRRKLNGIMVAYRELVDELHKFSLASK